MFRTRPKYTDEELAKIYAKPHDHKQWKDHEQRIDSTKALFGWFYDDIRSVADLSCGNGTLLDWWDMEGHVTYWGDYAPGYRYEGPLEKTIHEIPKVDLYICSETIEHLNEPLEALRLIRAKTKYLILTTPIHSDNQTDGNPEHYWQWDVDDMHNLLRSANFEPVIVQELKFFEDKYIYNYQMWLCK